MILAAILMNLFPAKYRHIGRFMDLHPWLGRMDILLVILFAFTPYLGYFALIQLFIYSVSPLWTRVAKPSKIN